MGERQMSDDARQKANEEHRERERIRAEERKRAASHTQEIVGTDFPRKYNPDLLLTNPHIPKPVTTEGEQ
jgi:hypothetical protein